MRSSEQLHELAVAALNGGRVASGRRLLQQAEERTGDEDLLARIELTRAYLEAETGDRTEALTWCARALARPGISVRTQGAVFSQRGLLLMLAGRTAEALADFASAVASLDDASDVLGRTHLNRGGVYLQRNEIDAAEADFRAAVVSLTAAGLPVELAMAEHNLGYCRLLRGDLVGALELMDRARLVLAPLSPVNEATCDQDRAEVFMAAGLIGEGRVALQTAARAYGSRHLGRRQAEAELALARSLLLEDPAQAAAAARRAARRFRATSAHAWRARAEAVALAAEVELGHSGPGLVVRGRALVEELTEQGLRGLAAAVRLCLARVQGRRGDRAAARRELSGLRIGAESPLYLRLLASDVRAELTAGAGRRSEALRHLRVGLCDLHEWQSTFGSLDLQTMVAGQGTRLGVRGLALAVESTSPAVLFEWSERARMLASRVQPVHAPQNDELAASLAELRGLAGSVDGMSGPAASRLAELRQHVREQAWQHAGSGAVVDPCGLPELQEALATGSALVAYVVTADRVVALVVTDRGAERHDLGPRAPLDDLLAGLLPDLDVAATALPGAVAVAVREELAARLGDLAEVLVAPLVPVLGDRDVVLTPSGVLAGTPWPLLPGLHGRPVTVAQSATTWLARRTTPLRTATAGLVAGPRVARAEAEVRAAASVWPVVTGVLTGAGATAAAVSDLAGRVDVLHLAAHGRHSAENPMFSGLELVDGPWFGYDIDQLPAVPDVVLLSACELGRSSVRWGEELIGMTTAWLHAGTRCVVASAAAVSDEVAHDVLVRVHRGLGDGEQPATALAHALPAVGPDGPPAPFVCFG